MKREILFRGKRVDNGEWVYGYFFLSQDMGWSFIRVENVSPYMECYTDHQVIPETVGQYTGLKDKNGKMIFEGDIVSHATQIGRDEVKWLQCQSKFVLGDGHPWGMIYKTYEIHGNIHDNPL
ncbi:YopX family protein [Niabella sp. CC-SYL272]|uniref:YopX family protein n=1 Tax=Niabella agricola TaxID=2891571 RepID=UPI001F181913|nr:YopX family protein [Niabella agricola]MCF3107274.1 YopX family protein [Niabella agricola]